MRECQSWVWVLPWVLTDPDIIVVHGNCPQQASMNPLDMKLKVSSHPHFLHFSFSLWDNFSVCVKMGVAVTVESTIKDLTTFWPLSLKPLPSHFHAKEHLTKDIPFSLMTTFLWNPSLHISMQMNTQLRPLITSLLCHFYLILSVVLKEGFSCTQWSHLGHNLTPNMMYVKLCMMVLVVLLRLWANLVDLDLQRCCDQDSC